jgi:hypothetical protein
MSDGNASCDTARSPASGIGSSELCRKEGFDDAWMIDEELKKELESQILSWRQSATSKLRNKPFIAS